MTSGEHPTFCRLGAVWIYTLFDLHRYFCSDLELTRPFCIFLHVQLGCLFVLHVPCISGVHLLLDT